MTRKSTALTSAKATAHVHSRWSDDGSWSLERIARTFRSRGYGIVLMSEHSRGFSESKWSEYIAACAEASTQDITLVPGIEYGDADNVVHMPVWGDVPFFGDGPDIGKLLTQVTEAEGTAVWAHPWRREAWRRVDPSWYEHLRAVEVWNRKYDGIAPNRRSVELSKREGITATVALDFHTRRQLFPLSLTLTHFDDNQPLRGGASTALVYTALASADLSPRGFGIPLDKLTSGLPSEMLQAAESARRATRRLLRRG